MRTCRVLVASVVALGFAMEAQAAGTRIGFVDVQKVLVKSVAGAAAREQLEREKAPMQKDFEARQAEAEKLREELEKKGLVLSAEAKREKEEVLQRKLRDLRRLRDDLNKELEGKEQRILQRILQDLTIVIDRVGKEKGYLLILEKRGASVIYGDPEADLTDEIIKVYDLEKSKEKK